MVFSNIKKFYRREADSLYSCQYVVSFFTKYKRNIFTEDDIATLEKSFLDTAEKYNFTILGSEILENQVTLIIDCTPTFGIENVVIKLKKNSSNALISKDKSFETRIPSIWTRDKFISTVGKVNTSDLDKFEDCQKTYGEIHRNKN